MEKDRFFSGLSNFREIAVHIYTIGLRAEGLQSEQLRPNQRKKMPKEFKGSRKKDHYTWLLYCQGGKR
ncbi:hypothetical protein NC652_034140 [Populus alba x Populus x berolinensis]|nr:hypothetical protein NC652_034140 [Populus alba x Populus x berolinensis]